MGRVRMAPRLIELEKEHHAGPDATRAAAYAVGRHETEAAHVWRGAREAWGKLARAHKFWK
jgi:hypothetical protein